jgi:membrane protein DedA with SNARE-associated domain
MTPGDAPAPDASAPEAAPLVHVPLPRPGRAVRWAVLGVAAGLMSLTFVATALSPALAARRPLLLLALESPIRNMLLASRVALVPFLAVATLRRLFGASVFFFLGRWYGDAAVAWLERRAGRHGAKVRRVERFVRAGAYPMVFLAPTAVVCVVAGGMGLPPAAFVACAGLGSLTLGVVMHLAGDALRGPIAEVVRLFERHGIGATLAATALAAVWAARQWKPRRDAP